jgi:hypothetical protein
VDDVSVSADARICGGSRSLNRPPDPSLDEVADTTNSALAYMAAILAASVRQSDSSSWTMQSESIQM